MDGYMLSFLEMDGYMFSPELDGWMDASVLGLITC